MLHSPSSTPATPIVQQQQHQYHHKESMSLPNSETDSFASMATLSPTSTASTDSSSSTSSHSSPMHVPASSGSSSVSFSSLGSSPSLFASPSSSYPSAVSVPSSNMSAALLQQQQQHQQQHQHQAQQKQHAIASSLLNSMQAHPPASFAHPTQAALTVSPTATASSSPPLPSFPASSSLPTPVPSTTSRRRGARRQRSPGHNRVPLWDTVRGKKLSGFASPMEKNLKRYLDEHPNCVLYDRNIHRVGLRSGTEASKEAEEEDDEDEDEEVPAELERIISSSPHSSSPMSQSPRQPTRVGGSLPPIRGQASRQQATDAIPRSMPMPVLSSSLPSHINIPPPLSTSLPNTSSASPHTYSPVHSPNMSPQHSPSAKIAIKFEQLTMSASSNSLSSLTSTTSSTSTGKVRKGAKKLTQSPRNKPILLASNSAVAPGVAIEGGTRSTVISRRTASGEDESSGYHGEDLPVMAATAVHPPPYHPALSVSVPLPSHVPQSVSARPLTVDTHFEGHSPPHSHSHYPHPHQRHYPQLHSSSLSRSTTCSPSHSSPSHVDPFSASSLNLSSPRRGKAKYTRAHPYHGDRSTPKYADGRGRLDEEAEYKESPRVGWSHSLPNSGPHAGMYAPPLIEVAADEAGHVCTCGGAQQYAAEGYYVQHGPGDPMFDVGVPVGYHNHHGVDVHHHMVPAMEMTDEYALYGHHHSYPHSHPHSHSHSHHNHASHVVYPSHSHAHHHAPNPASMHDNSPLRILSPVNGLSSAHSVSSESTHSSSSSNPSSKHLVYSRPISPAQPLSAHTAQSHSRTSPPLNAPATALYAVEVETKADGQTVVHHHHHYQVPGPVVSPSAWLVEGGVDDRVMADEGQWTAVSYQHHPTHGPSTASPPPQHGAQYIAVSTSPTPHQARLDDELYLAPTDHAGMGEYDLAAFDFTQLH